MARQPYAERISETAFHIMHPACGKPILLLKLTAHTQGIGVRGICYHCGRYVHLLHEVQHNDLDTHSGDDIPAPVRVGAPADVKGR